MDHERAEGSPPLDPLPVAILGTGIAGSNTYTWEDGIEAMGQSGLTTTCIRPGIRSESRSTSGIRTGSEDLDPGSEPESIDLT